MALYLTSSNTQKRIPNTLFYKERDKQNYLLVFTDTYQPRNQCSEAYASLGDHNSRVETPSMCHTAVSEEWLTENCVKTSFKKMPDAWQKMFRAYIEDNWIHHCATYLSR